MKRDVTLARNLSEFYVTRHGYFYDYDAPCLLGAATST
jgi:hypothetical protein